MLLHEISNTGSAFYKVFWETETVSQILSMVSQNTVEPLCITIVKKH